MEFRRQRGQFSSFKVDANYTWKAGSELVGLVNALDSSQHSALDGPVAVAKLSI